MVKGWNPIFTHRRKWEPLITELDAVEKKF